MSEYRDKLKHIILTDSVSSESYTSPNQVPRPRYPERTRGEHAQHLLSQVSRIRTDVQTKRDSVPVGAPAADGIYLEIDSKPGFDLTVKSLDLPSLGMELLSVRKVEDDEKTVATVFVPDRSISKFIRKLEQYKDEDTRTGKPKNKSLVESIDQIRAAVVRSLWTDADDTFPDQEESMWWEIWLRSTADALPNFFSYVRSRNILFSNRTLVFPDRYVVLAYTTANQIADSIDSLGFVAELRKAKETTAEFLQMSSQEQSQWTQALLGLLNHPSDNGTTVCILDTGVMRQHSLIEPFLPTDALHTCDPAWGANDREGHGTAMAGVVLYGDLNTALLSTSRVDVPCWLESVKVLQTGGGNPPELYGSITEEAVSRATVSDPNKDRILCMAITSTDDRDRGQPSSWSAAVDNICAGVSLKRKRHLFIISAGNITGDTLEYPEVNLTESIHDPGQSWNALTVGAFTEKDIITEPSFSGWSSLSPVGDIAPATTSSLTWQSGKWPIKPDVVFEGGNAAINPNRDEVDFPDSLAMLTTHHNPTVSQLTWTGDTSAASALASNMAANIGCQYPEFWPETIRALMVHSASWTDVMRQNYDCATKPQRERLLRICGFGVPNLNLALWSASNTLTLIAQNSLKPFDGNSMNEMNMHDIPWPTEVLRDLGEIQVKMKVTLSYFVEPNPARRGWKHKFSYQSHGLRFDVKTPEESATEFVTRLNRARWDEEQGRASITSSSDTSDWYFGRNIRSKGSIHSDIWEGTAARLADRSLIGVYPVAGWWREKHREGHTEKMAQYALIVTIETPQTDVDLYTPVENLVAPEIDIFS